MDVVETFAVPELNDKDDSGFDLDETLSEYTGDFTFNDTDDVENDFGRSTGITQLDSVGQP